jgi:6-pyruvoyltetrahydropterin/6-carboxytetrahydropterin synthase
VPGHCITVELRFAAAHRLREYHGKCEDLHGHNWTIEICVRGRAVDSIGMVMDFKKLRRIGQNVLDREFDHKYLNDDSPAFRGRKGLNPSAENIAKVIYDRVAAKLPKTVDMVYVRAWETPGCSAVYGDW